MPVVVSRASDVKSLIVSGPLVEMLDHISRFILANKIIVSGLTYGVDEFGENMILYFETTVVPEQRIVYPDN